MGSNNIKIHFTVYAAILLLFTVVYASLFALTFGIDALCTVADGVIFLIIFGTSAWSIINYAIPNEPGRTRTFLIVSSGILITCFTLGIETISAYLCGDYFSVFVRTLPLRALIVMLAYVVMILWHSSGIKNNPSQDTPEEADEPVTEARTESIEHITVRSGQSIKVIYIEDIEYIQAEGDYVAIVTAEGRWLKEQTMKYYEETLPQSQFIRIHRSFIVQTACISRIERYGKMHHVGLKNGEKIRVSDSGYKLLKERMQL